MSYRKDKLRKELQRTASAALLGDCFREVDRRAAERKARYDATLKLLRERLEVRRERVQESHEA